MKDMEDTKKENSEAGKEKIVLKEDQVENGENPLEEDGQTKNPDTNMEDATQEKAAGKTQEVYENAKDADADMAEGGQEEATVGKDVKIQSDAEDTKDGNVETETASAEETQGEKVAQKQEVGEAVAVDKPADEECGVSEIRNEKENLEDERVSEKVDDPQAEEGKGSDTTDEKHYKPETVNVETNEGTEKEKPNGTAPSSDGDQRYVGFVGSCGGAKKKRIEGRSARARVLPARANWISGEIENCGLSSRPQGGFSRPRYVQHGSALS